MKKLLTSLSLLFFCSVTGLLAEEPRTWEINYPILAITYKGPKDDTWWTDTMHYRYIHQWTALGKLARYSDVIGIGVVSNKQTDHFTVTVDTPLIGCTNGAVYTVYKGSEYGERKKGLGDMDAYMPTNNSRIVFAAHTNEFNSFLDYNYFTVTGFTNPPISVLPRYELRYLNRSWWYPERDNGLLLTQFTNIIQTARINRDWTNYFYLCRDGAFSESNRVREDAFYDIRSIIRNASDEQKAWLLKKPLLDEQHRALLLRNDWSHADREKMKQQINNEE